MEGFRRRTDFTTYKPAKDIRPSGDGTFLLSASVSQSAVRCHINASRWGYSLAKDNTFIIFEPRVMLAAYTADYGMKGTPVIETTNCP